MKTYKTFGIAAAAWAALACVATPSAAFADGPDGDIWYIGRADGGAHPIGETLSMSDNPVTKDEEILFRFRLLNRNYQAKKHGDIAGPIQWNLNWYGNNPDNPANKLKVGVWISGRRKWATVEEDKTVAVNPYFTDLVFRYKAEPGDFGILTLATGDPENDNAAAPASSDLETASTYSLLNRNSELNDKLWDIVDNYTTNSCNFKFTQYMFSDINGFVDWPYPDDISEDHVWPKDVDMSQAGIYVKTVDFDDYMYDTNGIWRLISAGGTTAKIKGEKVRDPGFSVPGGVAGGKPVTLYAWTEDETVARMNTDITYNGRHVAEIKIDAGADEKLLARGIRAELSATNKETTVYLCATPTNIFRSGVLITNFVTRTIRVGPPDQPSLTLLAQDRAEYTATAAGSTTGISPLVPISFDFGGVDSYPTSMTVTVTAEMIAAGSTNSPYSFIGLFKKTTEASPAEPNGTSATVTMDENGNWDGIVYAYIKRASSKGDDDTTAYDKGIRLKATVDSTAAAFFTGGIVPATLFIKPSAPVIATPEENALYSHVPGAVPYNFTVAVDDAYGETTSDAKYTVHWSNNGSFSDEQVVPDLSLVGGELTVPITYHEPSTAELPHESKFYVVNKDGHVSATRTIKVQADAAKTITLTADRPERRYSEGDTAMVSLKLSEGFSSGTVGYLFLVPKDEASSNLVDCTRFETGVSIHSGETEPVEPIEITFLDGRPSTLQYTAVLRSSESIAEGAEIGGFTSKPIVLTVSNVVPRVTSVTMAGTPFNRNGEIIQARLAKGVLTEYRVGSLIEPSEIDQTNENFLVQWDFFNKDHALLFTTNTMGDPTAPTGSAWYAFPTEGTNWVSVKVRDKDMTNPQYANAEAFTFGVFTMGRPAISLKSHRGSSLFSEDEIGPDLGVIDVDLNMAASEPITVEITVEHVDSTDTTMDPVLSTYYIDFPQGETHQTFFLKEMDGTDKSYDSGFRLTASVTNETFAPNSGNTKWKDYYTPYTYTIYIENKPPIIDDNKNYDASTSTNYATLNVPYTLRWKVTEVLPDITNDTLWVSWTVPGEGVFESYLTNVTTKSYTGYYTVTFTKQGNPVRIVTLLIRDKDGGEAKKDYIFLIDPQKPLSVRPLGPSSKGLTTLSQDYAGLPGRGIGRVWADGSLSKIVGFRQSWNYEQYSTVAYVYGYGYRAGEVDDGTLQPVVDLLAGTKLGINPVGNQADAAPWYEAYALYDSFFYCWIGTGEDGEDNSGNAPGVHLGSIAPPLGTDVAADSGQQRVALGESEDEENPLYKEVSVEAIFSREKYPKDNLGDINADDIPDYYAVSYRWKGGTKLFEAAEGTLEDGGDMRDLTDWNGDTVSTAIGGDVGVETGDYLPSMTSAGTGSLIPNIQSSWALYGQPFTASMELRGFGKGLNFRLEGVTADGIQGPNSSGAWISERDFTEVEAAACSNAWVAAGSPGNLEDFDWTPENRTDPTVDDTDGDGLPDGYEYYFWYHAYVGDPDTGKRLEGERFQLENIAVGKKITWQEIAQKFNPNAKSATAITERDSDGDGLTDLEEFAIGTNPVKWDTDGDGISDYWEVMRGLNPLVVESNTTVPNTNPDQDYMAYAVVGKDYALISIPDENAIGGVRMYAVANNGTGLVVKDGETISINEAATNTVEAIPVYRYGNDSSELVPLSRGSWAFEQKMCLNGNSMNMCQEYVCVAKPLDAAPIDWGEDIDLSTVTVKENQTLALVHDQVRAQYGFDPRTGWYMVGDGGYCSARWNPTANTVHARRIGPNAGLAVNTKAYSNLDEYLLLKYCYMTKDGWEDHRTIRRNFAKDKAEYDKKTTAVGGIFKGGTTNPNAPYSDLTYGVYGQGSTAGDGDAGSTFADNTHGADTDGDGVPDGWELYVSYDPNVEYNIIDNDGDGLRLYQEYAGTDSCNAYKSAVVANAETSDDSSEDEDTSWRITGATIYNNHPGFTKGWYNKFFPTDPWNGDTDGDYIRDDTEGGSWKNSCVLNNAMRVSTGDGNSYTFTFIYGKNEETEVGLADDGSLCIRGGGMNPCSVDTDFDLLPDPWEMCFAGVRARGGEPIGANFGDSVTTLLQRNDGIAPTNATDLGVYITGGMDATFGIREDNATFTGDAYTNPSFTDPRTGTVRNFDFDQDGLQNFQEYLVQGLRHLRYDDSETPLMGSWMPGGSPSSRKFLGFLPMNILDGETFYSATKAAGFVGGGAWQFRELGYFARPPHEWDPTALIPRAGSNYDAAGYRVMLPPHGLSGGTRLDSFGYASTDPRMWDSDNDNMGDYYEIFHGLNPLLGSIANTEPEGVPDPSCDVISQIYGGPMIAAFWKNAWTGWPMLPQDWLSDAAAYRDIDAIKYPWMIGTAEADADGDGIRNLEEALVVNMTSPQPTHTDPTPLWITDSTAPTMASFTAQYYQRDQELDLYPWVWTASGQTGDGAATGFLFSFEENEGYDTDHDWVADSEELIQTSTSITDPLRFTDPDRRQVMWFPGENSAAISYSARFHRLNYAAYDLLRQFTVEAWIKPEVLDREQVILERVAAYGASTLSNNMAQVRANFRIGITIGTDGVARLYGLFDSSDAITSGEGGGTAYVLGLGVTTNWTHVALSYNGRKLTLYINGTAVNSTPTTQAPANGIINFVEDAVPNMANFPVLNNGYKTVPCAIVLGAQTLDVNGIALSDKSTWASYGSFYQGCLDEVRVWDGVRTDNEITSDMTKRYTFDYVSALREGIYEAWVDGATRNDNDGYANLPAELVAHYNFQTLPGATESKYVAWEPSGFTKNVRDVGKVEGNNVPGDIYCGWWYATPVRSTVYKNWRLVPWIPNTVGHLPLMDGSAADSQYWSEAYGGMTLAGELNLHLDEKTGKMVGLEKIVFPNTANPYPYYYFTTDRRYHEFKLGQMVDLGILAQDVKDRYAFELRTSIVGSSDLVPLGGAFAKRTNEEMWDGNGPADAWALTGRDNDANGIPDWWEKVAKNNYGAPEGFTWDALVQWVDEKGRQIEMTAREAYLRDLQRGMLPTGTADKTFRNTADSDDDGLPDWWEDIYGIRSQNGLADADNDQLSNYAEYLISECFSQYGFQRVNPLQAHSFSYELGQKVPDYFLTVGKLYLGEMFGDHDFMEDIWEDSFNPDYVSRFVFDAWADPDHDGWSNWAECRADTDPTKQAVAGVDDYTVVQHPVPDIKATIRYYGESTLDAPIYVQAYPGRDTDGLPSAVWQIGSSSKQTKYMGMNPNSVVNFTLGSGSIQPGSLVAQIKSSMWVDAQGLIHYLADAAWVDYIHDTVDASSADGTKGILFFGGVDNKVGEIDYATGKGVLDFTKCQAAFSVGNSGSFITYYPDISFFVMTWKGVVPNGSRELTMLLSTPLPGTGSDSDLIWDETSGRHPSRGAVTEGLNTFVAFLDVDGNGTWTPGEPYGAVPDVDVGWSSASFTLELTDTSPSIPRINLREAVAAQGFEAVNALMDRGVLGNGAAFNLSVPEGSVMPAQTYNSVRVRIALNAINGRSAYRASTTSSAVYPDDVVFDQRLNLAANPFLTEKNLLSQRLLDLEWGTLMTQAGNLGFNNAADVTRATYRIVLGDGLISSSVTNNNLAVAFVNEFEGTRTRATPVSPQGTIYTQPTFKWTHNNSIGKAYPAFRLRVWTASSGGTTIYDSGNLPAPPRYRNSDGNFEYTWTAPIYPDMLTRQGKMFATTNNYWWSVSMLDAKFTTADSSETRVPFRLEASGQLGKISDYGMIKAKVRYFGPAKPVDTTKNMTNVIHVQAFTSPDFSGVPAGEARVTRVSDIASVSDIEPNAVILGLKPGTYYIRAFIDSDANSAWAKWESWGYANFVGAWDAALVSVSRGQVAAAAAGAAYVFTPRAHAVTLGEEPPVAEIYIEDMDSDNDGLPDAWEYEQKKSLATLGPPTGATFFTKVNTNLATTVKSYTELNASSFGKTYAPITLMNALLSGSAPGMTAAAVSLLADDESAGTENVAVKIDSFSLTGGLALTISSDVPQVESDGLAIFSVVDSAKVKVVLVAAKSPDFADAKETPVKTITIKANETTNEIVTAEELRAAIDDAGFGDAAFFKVRLESAE